jgi:protein TonB
VFDRLCESGRHRSRPALTAILLSALANAAVAFGAVTATLPPTPEARPDSAATTEALYLFPLPPERTPFEAVGMKWPGGDGSGLAAPAAVDGASLFAAAERGGDRGKGAGRRGARTKRREPVDSAAVASEVNGSRIYIESELDHPVAIDPTSSGPVYPVALQQAGIEGGATMRFVVDTTGLADPRTVEEVMVTHAAFAAAVREALPGMHYRPAELGTRRVRQLVEQQFMFRLQAVARTAPNDTTP